MSTISCPCSSGKTYAECCECYHLDRIAPQYSAYALHLIDYLWETTYPSKRYLYSKADIEKWAKANHWLKLEIVDAKKDIVEFKAFYQQGLKEYIHHEKSVFKKDAGKWYYFAGEHFH